MDAYSVAVLDWLGCAARGAEEPAARAAIALGGAAPMRAHGSVRHWLRRQALAGAPQPQPAVPVRLERDLDLAAGRTQLLIGEKVDHRLHIADPQTRLSRLVGERVQRHDGAVLPVDPVGQHGRVAAVEQSAASPAELGALAAPAD